MCFSSLVLFYILLLSIQCCALKDGCRISELDYAMKPLMKLTGLREAHWPENETELIDHCSTLSAQITRAKDYVKDCGEGISAALMPIVIHSVELMNTRTMCQVEREKKSLLASAKCGNGNRLNTTQCWFNWIRTLQTILTVNETKIKMPLMCCSVFEWKTCFLNVQQDIGSPLCSANDIEFFENYLYRSSLDPMSMFCFDYEESDRCDSVNKQLPVSDFRPAKYWTPFPIIIEIFESIMSRRIDRNKIET